MPTMTKTKRRTTQKRTVGEVVKRLSPAQKASLISASSRTPIAIAGSMADIVPQMYTAWGSGVGWQPAITWYQLATMYVSWEYTATEKIARTLAGLPAKLYRYEKQGKNVKPYFAKSIMYQYRQKNWHPDAIASKMLKDHGVKRVEIDEHPYLDLIEHPTSETVRYNFWRMLAIHLELDGAVGVYKAKQDVFGHPTELHILPTTWTGQFKPIPANDGKRIIKGYHLLDQNINTDFETDEIIWIHYQSLRNPFEGMSAIKAQLYSFNMDQYLMQQITAMYKNGAMFSNMFETDLPLTKTQYGEIAAQLSAYNGAKNAGQKFILHSGLKVAQARTETARDAMIDEVERMARDKMLSAHDLSAGKIGLTEHQNRSNLEVVDMGFFNEAIKPRAMLITEYFNPLVRSYDENLDFEFDYPHFQDRAQDIQERNINLTKGATTINEERDKMGMEAVDGGDVILVSPMLVPLSSVANPPEPVVQQQGAPPEGLKPKEPVEGVQPLKKPPVELPLSKTKLYNTPERKALAWKKYNAEATSYEPLFKRVAVKFFRDACAKVIDNLEQHGIKIKSNLGSMNLNSRQKWLAEHKDRLDEFLPKLSDLKSQLKDALKPALMSVLKSAAENQMKDLAPLKLKTTKADDVEAEEEVEFDLNDPRVIKWIGDRLDDTAETTAQTTIDATRQSLRTDFENGEPQLKMAEHLREYFTGAETYRANLIARTEATAATSQASIEAVVQMDLEDAVGKVWLTENDPLVRDTHADAGDRYSDGYDGNTDKVMGPDDEFVVGSDSMTAPGNGGVAEEVCNCRCGLVWEPIK